MIGAMNRMGSMRMMRPLFDSFLHGITTRSILISNGNKKVGCKENDWRDESHDFDAHDAPTLRLFPLSCQLIPF